MEENSPNNSPITMILYTIDNDKRTPSQNWEIIPKKKYIIGRSKKEVDLPLNLKLLSRKHAELIYYDSKTIMIKDLNSRNGTFINKLKIETMKETFFTNKEKLSFGNTNNEIIFFDNSEQHKDNLPLTDSEKNQESDNEKKESNEKQIEINRENEKIVKYENLEEINTDIKQENILENGNNPINNTRKERESKSKINERLEEREMDSYNKYNKNSKESSKQSEIERDKNNLHSTSNRDNYNKKKEIIPMKDSSYERRSDRYNMPNKSRDSHRLVNKSISREKPNYSRSRSRSHSHSGSGSRETLIQHNNYNDQRREEPKEKNRYDKDYYSYDNERERERERRDYYKRKEYEERRREDEYRRRRSNERERENERERDYYNKERRRDYNDNYFEKGDNIYLRPNKLEIVMDQNNLDQMNNKNDKDGDMGYIKCYVEGYMYLKIRKSENK